MFRPILSSAPCDLSSKRLALCSRINAQRVAARMIDEGAPQVSIVRTGHPLQPLRVVPNAVDGADVELEMRLA